MSNDEEDVSATHMQGHTHKLDVLHTVHDNFFF